MSIGMDAGKNEAAGIPRGLLRFSLHVLGARRHSKPPRYATSNALTPCFLPWASTVLPAVSARPCRSSLR